MYKYFLKSPWLILSFILISKNVYTIELQHTFDLRTGAEINTSFGWRLVNEAKYELILDKHWQLSPGLLLAPGWSFLSAYNLETGYNQLFIESLSVHLKFLNMSYHAVSVAENSIIPYFSWRSKNFEADLGLNFRFTNFGPQNLDFIFYYPKDLFLTFFVFRIAGYLNWENPGIRLGIEMKNIDWNYAGNSMEISFDIDGIYQITNALALKLNMGTIPSGISGLSLDFNRFNILLGAQYRL
ncbi:MAG: hypothetical protein OEV78_11195 [Spirochaetia bacterium]|nr:hypothetical protein [Spirochaetia bacterium]